MELVEGNGLDALIAAEERVPEDRVLRLTLDIVRGLDAAWNAGLMHRDIKPANVLLSPDGAAKIVDFGLSLLHSESDMEREIWVTPYYAAPETLLRGEEDFRTDMYALGATMYHLLAGAPPRVDASQSSDILLENKKNLPRLEQVVNDVSPMTCFIVDRLMAFDREDRFSSYPELMDAVAQAQEEYARAMQESGLHLGGTARGGGPARTAQEMPHHRCLLHCFRSGAGVGRLGMDEMAGRREFLLPQLRLRPFLLRRKLLWKTGGGGIAAGAQHPLRQTV